MKKFISLIACLALAFSTLPGCASKYGEQKTAVNYYPGCYQPLRDLRESEHTVAKGTASGAAIGALGGALLGFLTSGGKWQGALTGAAMGGATGAVTGNLYAQKQKEMDDNRRLASYLQDLDGDISNIDLTAAAARTSFNCYEKAFNRLVSDIKARRISREAAMRRFAEIRSGEEEASAILGDLVVQTEDLETRYDQAFAQEEQAIATPQKASQGPRAYEQKQQTLNRARTRAKKLTQKKQTISSEQDQMNNTVVENTERWNSILSDYESSMSDARS